jgi:argininosuccinate lyase
MPGFTTSSRRSRSRLGHHFMAYYEMLARDAHASPTRASA